MQDGNQYGVTRISFAQRLCPRCGKCFGSHQDKTWRTCTVPDEVLDELRRFRAEYGRTWKFKLRALWAGSKAWFGPEREQRLRQARNIIGPYNLDKINLDATLSQTGGREIEHITVKPIGRRKRRS